MDTEKFKRDPRAYALDLVDAGRVSADIMLLDALNAMSHEDVRDMLDANELSPRFDEDEDEPEDEPEPVHVCENCNWQGPEDELGEIQHIGQRLDPGSEVPSGECPDCGALAYIQE